MRQSKCWVHSFITPGADLSKYSSKAMEANLYIIKQVLEELSSYEVTVSPEILHIFLDYARIALQDSESRQMELTLPTNRAIANIS